MQKAIQNYLVKKAEDFFFLTLGSQHLYLEHWKGTHCLEQCVFSIFSEEPTLKNFLQNYPHAPLWVILDVPEFHFEYRINKPLNRIKEIWQAYQVFRKGCLLVDLPPNGNYSHSLLKCESALWEKWHAFLKALPNPLMGILPFSYLWTYSNFSDQEWTIYLLKTPDEDLRYIAYYKRKLIYSRVFQNIPSRLEGELYHFYAYLKRDYPLQETEVPLYTYGFDPEELLKNFAFPLSIIPLEEQIKKQVSVTDPNLYHVNPFLIHEWMKNFSFENLGGVLAFIKNRLVFKGSNWLMKINSFLMLVVLLKSFFYYLEKRSLEKELFLLKAEETKILKSERIYNPPLSVVGPLIRSLPIYPLGFTFIEKLAFLKKDFITLKGWEWHTAVKGQPMKAFLALEIGHDSAQTRKAWIQELKNQFQPFYVEVLKKKRLKENEKWHFDILITEKS